MESCDRAHGEGNVPHAKVRLVSMADKEDCSRKQEAGPGDDDCDVSDAESIGIDSVGHIVAICEPMLKLRLAGESGYATLLWTINGPRQPPTWRSRRSHPFQRVACSIKKFGISQCRCCRYDAERLEGEEGRCRQIGEVRRARVDAGGQSAFLGVRSTHRQQRVKCRVK